MWSKKWTLAFNERQVIVSKETVPSLFGKTIPFGQNRVDCLKTHSDETIVFCVILTSSFGIFLLIGDVFKEKYLFIQIIMNQGQKNKCSLKKLVGVK